MKRLRRLRRWFARKFGYARLVCLAILIALAALRVADPAPVAELRDRVFDTFQRFDPRVKTARPVTIIDIDEKSLAKFGQWPGTKARSQLFPCIPRKPCAWHRRFLRPWRLPRPQ